MEEDVPYAEIDQILENYMRLYGVSGDNSIKSIAVGSSSVITSGTPVGAGHDDGRVELDDMQNAQQASSAHGRKSVRPKYSGMSKSIAEPKPVEAIRPARDDAMRSKLASARRMRREAKKIRDHSLLPVQASISREQDAVPADYSYDADAANLYGGSSFRLTEASDDNEGSDTHAGRGHFLSDNAIFDDHSMHTITQPHVQPHVQPLGDNEELNNHLLDFTRELCRMRSNIRNYPREVDPKSAVTACKDATLTKYLAILRAQERAPDARGCRARHGVPRKARDTRPGAGAGADGLESLRRDIQAQAQREASAETGPCEVITVSEYRALRSKLRSLNLTLECANATAREKDREIERLRRINVEREKHDKKLTVLETEIEALRGALKSAEGQRTRQTAMIYSLLQEEV